MDEPRSHLSRPRLRPRETREISRPLQDLPSVLFFFILILAVVGRPGLLLRDHPYREFSGPAHRVFHVLRPPCAVNFPRLLKSFCARRTRDFTRVDRAYRDEDDYRWSGKESVQSTYKEFCFLFCFEIRLLSLFISLGTAFEGSHQCFGFQYSFKP